MRTDVDTCLKEIAGWYVQNRREITEPELEAIITKHCESEAEVQKFIGFLASESGQVRFKTLLRERTLYPRAKEPWQMTLEEWAYAQQKKYGYGPPRMDWIKAGYGEVYRGHKEAVKRALKEGKPVPPEVLRDYPELTKESNPGNPNGGGLKTYNETAQQIADDYLERARGVVETDESFREDNPDMTIREYALDTIDSDIKDATLTGQPEWKSDLKQIRKLIQRKENSSLDSPEFQAAKAVPEVAARELDAEIVNLFIERHGKEAYSRGEAGETLERISQRGEEYDPEFLRKHPEIKGKQIVVYHDPIAGEDLAVIDFETGGIVEILSPDLKPPAVEIPEAEVPTTNWKQAQIEASTRVEEIENEWLAKNFLGPTREQQGRIDSILADAAKKYSVPLSTLRKATLWEADGKLIGVKRTPLTEAEIDALIAGVSPQPLANPVTKEEIARLERQLAKKGRSIALIRSGAARERLTDAQYLARLREITEGMGIPTTRISALDYEEIELPVARAVEALLPERPLSSGYHAALNKRWTIVFVTISPKAAKAAREAGLEVSVRTTTAGTVFTDVSLPNVSAQEMEKATAVFNRFAELYSADPDPGSNPGGFNPEQAGETKEYVSPKQVKAWHWETRTGVIRDKLTGKHIYGDRIGALWVSASETSKIRTPDLRRVVARTDGFIYFSIGNKRYKTDLVPGSDPVPLPGRPFEGKAYRVDIENIGIPRGATAGDVVRFEEEELGNELGVTDEVLRQLDRYSASDVVWVTKKKEDAKYYLSEGMTMADITTIDLGKGRIVAEDGQGGFLVLRGGAKEIGRI